MDPSVSAGAVVSSPSQTGLGERLRIARSTAGLTQEQAAKALNVARTTMVAIERGERGARPEELVTLATLYRTTVNALLRREAVHVELNPQFRGPLPGKGNPKAATQAVQLLHQLATSTVELENRLGKQFQFHYVAEQPLSRGQLEQQAEDLALDLRNRLGLGLNPISDIFALAELELGIRVFVRRVASEIAGVFAYHPQIGACILINSNHPRARQCWTLAHDIAHFLVSRSGTDICFAEGEKPPTERFADLFAAALLLPAAAMRRYFAEVTQATGKFSSRDLIVLAHRYRVSAEAGCRRLEQLELVPSGTYDMLRDRGLSQRTYREVLGDNDEQTAPPPLRLAMLAAEAHERGLLSEAQVATMLAIDLVEARKLLDEWAEGEDDLVVAK